MKKLTTFLAASLLGLSSLASAAPSHEMHGGGSAHVTAGVTTRDHRGPSSSHNLPAEQQVADHSVVRPASAWRELGTVGTGERTIVPADRELDTLTLEVQGRVEIDKVAVYFKGQISPQIIKIRSTLTSGSQMPLIDLAGSNREIKRVVVYSTKSASGKITVLGRNGRDQAQSSMPGWSTVGAMATGTQRFTLRDDERFDSLALAANGSNVELSRIKIHYADGTERAYELDTTIGANRKPAVIDLVGNKKVKAVTVYTDADASGDVMLFAK